MLDTHPSVFGPGVRSGFTHTIGQLRLRFYHAAGPRQQLGLSPQFLGLRRMHRLLEQPVAIRLRCHDLGKVQRRDQQLREVGSRRRAELYLGGLRCLGRLAELDAADEGRHQGVCHVADGLDGASRVLLLDVDSRELLSYREGRSTLLVLQAWPRQWDVPIITVLCMTLTVRRIQVGYLPTLATHSGPAHPSATPRTIHGTAHTSPGRRAVRAQER